MPTDADARRRELRQRAEQLLSDRSAPEVANLSQDELVSLAREVRLHRIELDLQHDELLQAQAELRASEQRYRALYELAPVGYVTLGARGELIELNRAAARLLGRAPDRELGEDFAIYVDPGQREAWLMWRRSLDLGARRDAFELRLRRPDGALVHVDVLAAQAHAAAEAALELALVDVTAQRRLELASKDRSDRIRRLFDGLPVLIGYVDRERRYVFVNAAHESWFGLPRSEMVGRTLLEVMGEVRYAWLSGALESALRGKPASCEGELPDFGGVLRSAAATLMPDVDATGEVQGAYCLVQDLTALRRVETELRSIAEDVALAEQRERMRVAFELHDDVGQVLAYVTMKLRAFRTGDAAEREALLSELDDQLVRARERITSLSFQLNPPWLHEQGLRAAALWLADEVRRMHGITVHIEEGPELDGLSEAVRIVLYRSLRELILNVARHAQSAEAFVALRASAREVEIEVRDRGIGFDGASFGFGLASLRTRIFQLGGELAIESTPGSGTQARVRVPVPAARPPGRPRSAR